MVKRGNFGLETLTVLRLLDSGTGAQYPAGVAGLLGLTRSGCWKVFKRLEGAGLIKRKLRSSCNIYEVTRQGKEFVKLAGRVLDKETSKPLFRYHNLLAKLPVFEGLDRLKPGLLVGNGFRVGKRGFLGGWERAFKGCRVFFTGKSFLLFPDPLWARSNLDAVEKLFGLVESIGGRLEELFGVRLPVRCEVCRSQMALVGGFSAWIPEGFSFVGETVIIDFSTGVPEFETYGKFTVDGMLKVAEHLDGVAKGDFEARQLALESRLGEVLGLLEGLRVPSKLADRDRLEVG